MNKKEETLLWNIVESILVECTIQCQKCNKVSTAHNIDDIDYAEILIREGWTFKRDKVLCPDCNKLKTKQ